MRLVHRVYNNIGLKYAISYVERGISERLAGSNATQKSKLAFVAEKAAAAKRQMPGGSTSQTLSASPLRSAR